MQPDDAPPPPPASRPRTAVRLACLLAPLALLGAASGALLGSASGLGWALNRLPGLQVQDVQGSLLGQDLRLRQLRWTDGRDQLQIDQLQLQGLRWQWRPASNAWLGLQIGRVQAGRLQWTSGPSSGPLSAPADLGLPAQLQVDALHLAQLQIDQLAPVTELQARLSLGPDGQHQVQGLRLRQGLIGLEGEARIGTRAPLPLTSELRLHSLDGAAQPWSARLRIQGPLARLAVQAELQGQGRPGGPAAQAAAQATVQPFAAWPLGALSLDTRALDLASLHAAAPRTQLSGNARLSSQGLDQPFELQVTLDNARPERWDQGGLPLRRLTLAATGQPAPGASGPSLQQLRLDTLQLDLPAAQGQRSALRGQGTWQARDAQGEAQLDLQLDGLRPAALDQRLAAMTLSGPLQTRWRGLPPPAVLLGQDAGTPQPRLSLQAQLQGRLDAARGDAPEVRLSLDADAEASGHLLLREAQARAGSALARLQGRLDKTPAGRWQWQLQGALEDFDPLPWFPGEPGSAWRRGPHRLNARLQSEASLPDGLQRLDLPQLLRQLAGQVQLTLAPSQLAGVAVEGSLSLDRSASIPVNLNLLAGGNRLALNGSAGSPQQDARWDLALEMPRLATLGPLFALSPSAAAWAPRNGELSGTALAHGRDSRWQWQGRAQVAQLSGPGYEAERLMLQAQGGSALDDALALRLSSTRLRHGSFRLDQGVANVSGSLRQHQLTLELASPVRPPLWFEQMLGARTGAGTWLEATADGRWTPAADAPAGSLAGQWQGRLARLLGRASNGSGQPWLLGEDLRLALQLDAQGQLSTARAEPGRLVLPGTALRWTEARYEAQPGDAPPHIDLMARIEPFAVAPLMDRAQPELGWRGDLVMGGEITLRRHERFDAELVFERQSGDLSVADDVADAASRIQPLGLSDLRLGLSAHDGVWHFTQALAGRQLGEMAGVATVRTRAELAWPEPQAPLDGVVQMRVANLGAWGAWVPPGWRLGGALQLAAGLGGRFGAPELTGRLSGQQLSARNVLLGLQFSEGNVEVGLAGAKATIERFSLRGGEGRVTVQGEASLGASPEARLQLVAERFLLLGRVDRRLVTSGQATLGLTREALNLDAQLSVDEGLIDFSRGDAPGLDDDVSVRTAAPASAAEDSAPLPARPLRPTVLNARLDLGQQLRVKGRGLDTTLRGDLKISNPGGKLAVHGAVRTERGTYAAYGQKLEIERGLLSFNGPVEDPRLDIFAVRPNVDVTVGVAVTGSALNPRVRLASEPEMSDTYKLSWLVLGREPDGLGQADTALLQRAAVALLAGEGEAPTDAFLRTIGLTDFSLRQTAASSSSDVRETVVSLGKQLSRRWYVGYERGVNATTGTWQLIYRAAQRFTLRAQSGEDNAIDLIWSWRWP